jgi:DNA-directed RNA polymerase subunit RPC12/RpoP
MTIQFRCPSCRRSLKVKDAWAGKRAECPACKHVIPVPAASSNVDVEELAAAALSDQPQEGQAESKTIDFPCSFCDEKIQAGLDLAEKRMPCPHCGKIVKVPKLAISARKDWRQKGTVLPSAARRDDEPAPEGAWGTGVTRHVSAEALLDAKAIKEPERRPREPMPARRKVALGMVATLGAALLALGIWQSIRYRARSKQDRAFGQVESILLAPTRGPMMPGGVQATELYRAAGEYSLRENHLNDAFTYFSLGRSAAATDKPKDADKEMPSKWTDHELALIDLAATQSRLLGDAQQVSRHQRLSWNETQTELYRTLQGLGTPEGRAEAIRSVSRRILARGPNLRVDSLVNMLGRDKETPELLGIIGLEAIRADQKSLAADIAKVVLAPYEVKPVKGQPERRLPPATSFLALLIILDQQPKAEKLIAPAPKPADAVPDEVRVGYALGWTRVGKNAEAHALAKAAAAETRFHALVEIAEAEADADPKSATPDVAEARNLLTGELKARFVSPWLLLRFLRLALRTGAINAPEQLPDLLKQADIVRQAQLEIAIYRLDNSTTPDMEALAKAAKESPPFGPVLEALARLNARTGDGAAVMSQADGWTPETMRPFGYAGVALGLQDRGR